MRTTRLKIIYTSIVVFLSPLFLLISGCSPKLKLNTRLDNELLKLNELVVKDFSITMPNIYDLNNSIVIQASKRLEDLYRVKIINDEIYQPDKLTLLTNYDVKLWNTFDTTYRLFVKYEISDENVSKKTSFMAVNIKTASNEEINREIDSQYLIDNINFDQKDKDSNNTVINKWAKYINKHRHITKSDLFETFIGQDKQGLIYKKIREIKPLHKKDAISLFYEDDDDDFQVYDIDNEDIESKFLNINKIEQTERQLFNVIFKVKMAEAIVSRNLKIEIINDKTEISTRRAEEVVEILNSTSNSDLGMINFDVIQKVTNLHQEHTNQLMNSFRSILTPSYQRDELLSFEFTFESFTVTTSEGIIKIKSILVKYMNSYANNSHILTNKFYFRVKANQSEAEAKINSWATQLEKIENKNIGMLEFKDETKIPQNGLQNMVNFDAELKYLIRKKINPTLANDSNLSISYSHPEFIPENETKNIAIKLLRFCYYGVCAKNNALNNGEIDLVLSVKIYQKTDLEKAEEVAQLIANQYELNQNLTKIIYSNQDIITDQDPKTIEKITSKLHTLVTGKYKDDTNIKFEVGFTEFRPSINETTGKIKLTKLIVKYNTESYQIDLDKTPFTFIAVTTLEYKAYYEFLAKIRDLYLNFDTFRLAHNGYSDVSERFELELLKIMIFSRANSLLKIDNYEIIRITKKSDGKDYLNNLPRYQDISKQGEDFEVKIRLDYRDAHIIFDVNLILIGVK